MKKSNINLMFSLFATLLLFACSEKDLMKEDVNLNLAEAVSQEAEESINSETFVSKKQALEIAENFLNREVVGTRAFSSAKASIAIVKDEKSNSPAMYVVNYPEGGWAIISATKDYYPVLAYSEEGAFEIKQEAEMGGVVVWLEETKEAVKVSAALADSTKILMRHLWQTYEVNADKVSSSPTTRNYTIMNARINQLQNLYGSSGWKTYVPLDEAGWDIGDPYLYQSILDMASMYGSPPQYTIVGIKHPSTTHGPLLSTKWHQFHPFNYLCPPNTSGSEYNYPAGCVAVAMAQIMKYHTKPAIVTSPVNHKYNWYNMPDTESEYVVDKYTYPYSFSDYSTPALIRSIGVDVNMRYGIVISTAKTDSARIVFQSYGYTASVVDNNATDVNNAILNNKPVFMTGNKENNPSDMRGFAMGYKFFQTLRCFLLSFLTAQATLATIITILSLIREPVTQERLIIIII